MAEKFIRDIKAGERVENMPLLVYNRRLIPFSSPNKAGQFFLHLTLGDVSGRINAVLWEGAEEKAEGIREGAVVAVTGPISSYREKLQITLENIQLLPPESINPVRLVPVAPRDRREMVEELQKVVKDEIRDAHLQELLAAFFSDNSFTQTYSRAPAAKNVHHNWLGGLLQHSLEVYRLCRSMVALYPGINESVLFTGALLHDIGKLEEYSRESLTFDLTTRGKLMGHIVIGANMVEKKIDTLPGFPPGLAMEIIHMIVSHHGCQEWGSPEVPKTFEAFALFHADLVSGRLNQFHKIRQQAAEDGEQWSEYDRLLERSIYVPAAPRAKS